MVTGLPKDGGALSKIDPKAKEVRLAGTLPVGGRANGTFIYRVAITAMVPGEGGGTLPLQTNLRTEQDSGLFSLAPLAFEVPVGPANRSVELEARLVVEVKSPDALRSGIVAGMQVFGPDGKPVGAPVIGKVRPGTLAIEQWPFGPTPRAEWVFTLTGDKALPAAVIKDFKVEVEP